MHSFTFLGKKKFNGQSSTMNSNVKTAPSSSKKASACKSSYESSNQKEGMKKVMKKIDFSDDKYTKFNSFNVFHLSSPEQVDVTYKYTTKQTEDKEYLTTSFKVEIEDQSI